MIKALIVEDEELAARKLSNLLQQSNTNFQVLDILDSVESSIAWFNNNPAPDLIFLDIQLADGLSFEIFEKVEVTSPVLFVTAYDEYALRAFKLNSIDYLLKPVELPSLEKALEKFELLKKTFSDLKYTNETVGLLERMIMKRSEVYKNRFIVKVGTHIYPVNTSEILCFSSSEGITYLHTTEKKYPVEYPLDKLEGMLDPELFFRVNRNYIIRNNSIKEMVKYSSNRLKLLLMFKHEEDVVVSRDRMAEFKKWIDS